MSRSVDFGLLLPHFGPSGSVERVLETARRAEALGFDSLWVRDHLYVPPERRDHGGIREGMFLEGLLTHAAVGSVTDDVALGTAILNPHRHPVKLSQNLGTLAALAGDRLICGVGAGTSRAQFEAVDLPFERRGRLAEETMAVLRRTATGTDVEYDGDHYAFDGVTIDPPAGGSLGIWYGGLAPVAVERAATYADGWLPGRTPRPVLEERLATLDGLLAEQGRSRSSFPVGYVSLYSVADTTDEALAALPVEALIEDLNALHPGPDRTRAEVESSLVAGTPAECRAQIVALGRLGIDHLILDVRHNVGAIDRLLEVTADSVLSGH